MPQDYPPAEEYYTDVMGRLKDMEEKQRLLRDRILLVGKNLVEDRESMMQELQEMKKVLTRLREENIKIQDFLKNVANQMAESVRKEELLMLQRQLDLFMTARGRNKE